MTKDARGVPLMMDAARVLASIVRDGDVAVALMSLVRADDFGVEPGKGEYVPAARRIFNVIAEVWAAHGTMPTFDMIATSLDGMWGSDSDKESARTVLETMRLAQRCSAEQVPVLIEGSKKWITSTRAKRVLYEAIELLKENEGGGVTLDTLVAAAAHMEGGARSITDEVGGDDDDIESLSEGMAAALEVMHTDNEDIPIGVPELDEVIGGGLRKETVTMVAARYGVGKSVFVQHIAISCAMRGFVVVYIDLEMGPTLMLNRFYAHVADVHVSDLIHSKELGLSLIPLVTERTGNRLFARSNDRPLSTVPLIEAYVRKVIRRLGRVDVVCVDYVSCLTQSSLRESKNTRTDERLGAISRELQAMAVRLKTRVVAAQQLNRQDEMAQADAIAWPATIVFKLQQDDEEAAAGTMRVTMDKNRQGPPRGTITIGVDYSRTRIMSTQTAAKDVDVPDSVTVRRAQMQKNDSKVLF